ncbi:unnamed protein product, partial [Mesorhabditis spiculigera]
MHRSFRKMTPLAVNHPEQLPCLMSDIYHDDQRVGEPCCDPMGRTGETGRVELHLLSSCALLMVMDVVATRGEELVSGSAPGAFLPCRRASSFPYFGSPEHDHIFSPSHLRSQSASEGLNRIAGHSLRHLFGPHFSLHTTPLYDYAEEASPPDSETTFFPMTGFDDELTLTYAPLIRKKSVRFADDCGEELCTVKVMTEPQYHPPSIPEHVLRRHHADLSYLQEEKTQPTTLWIPMFTQPAADFVKFRERLDTSNVALENVVMRNELRKLEGTIKVTNIAFEKKVLVRFTTNGWRSYNEKAAVFQPSTSKTYDTFAFELELPAVAPKDSLLEFCIRYDTAGLQFWDSNLGANYKLKCATSAPASAPQKTPKITSRSRLDSDDAYRFDYDNWTKFASWKQLSTDGPYW